MRSFGVLFGVVAVLAAVVVSGSALSLCDYISPTTSLSRMRLSFNYRYFDDAFTDEVDVSSGRSRLEYSSLYDSPSLGYSLSALGELTLSELQISRGSAHSEGTLRYYFEEEQPFFAFAGFDTRLDTDVPGPALDVSAGLGYGRFTDVTPLAKAMRIEAMLLAREEIPASLPDATLMALAEEIGKRVEYETVDELVQELVTAIEEEAGVSVDARAVLAMENTVLATGDERHCGWAVQGGLSYEVLEAGDAPGDTMLSCSASMALPPAPESQILFEAGIAGPIDIADKHTATLSGAYEYTAGALDVSAQLLLRREKEREEEPEDTASANLAVAFPVRGASVTLELGLTKPAEATRISTEFSVSLMLRLI
ncbi:MAG: hypothetical protein R6U88_03640 [Candidatus Bipolaricaulota bacterium]